MDMVCSKYIKNACSGLWVDQQRVNGLTLGLSKTAFVPSLNSVIGDIIRPTYTGYADVDAESSVCFQIFDGLLGGKQTIMRFLSGNTVSVCTVTPGAPELVYGQWIIDGITGDFLGSVLFPQPIPVLENGNGVLIDLDLFHFADSFMP